MTARRKIVVLGAHAFSGQDFVDLLLDDPNNDVIGVSRSTDRLPFFLKFKERADLSRYRFVPIDLNRNLPDLLKLLDAERPHAIVNFAAQSEVAPSWDAPQDWFQTNTVALAVLVNHLRRQDYLKRYVHVSSPEVYGSCVGRVTDDAPMNPSTPYAASKASADLLLSTYFKQFRFPLLTVRGTNVYGARQQLFKIIPRTVIYMMLGKQIELHGGGVAVKSYIHIRDISRGELAILDKGDIGKIYNLSPDAGVSVKDVVRTLAGRMGKSFEEVTRTVEERPGQDAAYVIDSTRARTELGWKPTVPLEKGLSEVVDWVEKNWADIKNQPLQYIHRS